ncbi:MAG: ATP-binding protein [Microcystaceae cyanobacterium]
MIFSPLKVTNFLDVVPMCQQTDSLQQLFDLISAKPCHCLVVTTHHQYPVGLLLSHELLSYCFLNQRTASVSSSRLPLSENRNNPIKQFPHLIHPLTLLSSQTSITTISSQLLVSPPPNYVIVDEQQRYLGLLDLNRSLQGLTEFTSSTQPQIQDLRSLLISFPLPILLTTPTGEIIDKNTCWTEKLGDFQLHHLEINDFPNKLQFSTNAHHTYVAAQLASWQHHQDKKMQGEEYETTFAQNPDGWQFLAYPYPDNENQRSLILIIGIRLGKTQEDYRALEAKNADLLQLNRLKDDFLASISHELKSPITAVVGLSSLLTDQRVGDLNPAQERYAQLIYGSGRQLMALVNDLLDLTRLETGKLPLNPTNITIQEICDHAYQTLQENYGEQPLPHFQLAIEQIDEIKADEQRLCQMLVYLLDNAVKFTQSEGNIGLTVKADAKWVTFIIWDTGEGIPEEAQSSLFQGFQPPGQYFAPHYTETGLGLLLTQRLAKAHGGDLSFVSKVGKGSRFTLLLPRIQNLADDIGAEKDKNPKLVLIVETLSHFIEDLNNKLAELGYQSVISRTGTEALEKARQLQPTLIFLNPWLPLLSGWDVLTLLKSDPQTQKIRVILTDSQTDSSLKSYQADEVFSQPIAIEQLKSLLPKEEPEKIALASPKTEIPPLTLLLLYPNSASLLATTLVIPDDLALVHQLSKYSHRILQADDLSQAAMLATIWQVDVLVVKGDRLDNQRDYWHNLSQFPELSNIPLVSLDTATTEALDFQKTLNVFPYVEGVNPLWKVVQQAAQSR